MHKYLCLLGWLRRTFLLCARSYKEYSDIVSNARTFSDRRLLWDSNKASKLLTYMTFSIALGLSLLVVVSLSRSSLSRLEEVFIGKRSKKIHNVHISFILQNWTADREFQIWCDLWCLSRTGLSQYAHNLFQGGSLLFHPMETCVDNYLCLQLTCIASGREKPQSQTTYGRCAGCLHRDFFAISVVTSGLPHDLQGNLTIFQASSIRPKKFS